MSWRQVTVARILLLVAMIVSDDPEVSREIKTLATHISVGKA